MLFWQRVREVRSFARKISSSKSYPEAGRLCRQPAPLCSHNSRIGEFTHSNSLSPVPNYEPYGISSCRKTEDWKGPGSAVLGHSWEARNTELLTTGAGKDPGCKLSSVLPRVP